ncbi:MAG: DUF5675 family protein [Spirosomataceae bacterium]
MDLYLTRKWFSPTSTISELFLPVPLRVRRKSIFILEDTDRGLTSEMGLSEIARIKDRFPGACAIPTGRYPLVLDFSPKFNKVLLELTGVKGFTETKFHAGNTPVDTAGCLLTGLERRNDEVRYSNQALELLHRSLEPVFENEAVFLTVNRHTHALPYRR